MILNVPSPVPPPQSPPTPPTTPSLYQLELIVLWSFKQMSTRRSEPKVTEILISQGDGGVCAQIVSVVLMCTDTAKCVKIETNSVCMFFFFFGWYQGLKVCDRKIKDFTSSEFTLLICLTQDSCGTVGEACRWVSEPSRGRKKKRKSLSFNTWVGGKYVCACLCMGYCVRVAFVLALQCDFWQ